MFLLSMEVEMRSFKKQNQTSGGKVVLAMFSPEYSNTFRGPVSVARELLRNYSTVRSRHSKLDRLLRRYLLECQLYESQMPRRFYCSSGGVKHVLLPKDPYLHEAILDFLGEHCLEAVVELKYHCYRSPLGLKIHFALV